MSIDRRGIKVVFGTHAEKDKNLTFTDIEYVVKTVRIGKVDHNKSTEQKQRICFKNYFKEEARTYFVIVDYYPTFFSIVTVIKRRGKY